MQNKNHHYPESKCSRADKMSGHRRPNRADIQRFKKLGLDLAFYKLGKDGKSFFTRKRRMFLKNPIFFDKI